jgi:hypothetical protein
MYREDLKDHAILTSFFGLLYLGILVGVIWFVVQIVKWSW